MSLPRTIAAITFVCGSAFAQSGAGDTYFESKVRPVLVRDCYGCHGPQAKTAFGNLRLSSRENVLKGGDSGPAIVPGKPDQSLLISAVRYDGSLKMPPAGKIPQADVDVLTEWVKLGAPWPDSAVEQARMPAPTRTKTVEERRKDHWAWQPVRKATPPAVRDTKWADTAIDKFILARLESAKLTPARDADPYTLVRRIWLTLAGLPPTPEEVEAFAKDPSDRAFAAMVDRLLASPGFGEKWGRHWLDSTYFADTMDVGRRIPAPHAWRYRDYVIDSFNGDKPFRELIREQVAGDLLPFSSPEQRRSQLIATGFLSLGPWALVNADKEQLKMDVIDLQIDLIGKSVLGLTLACARCHDHKFDPIPQKDYYAVAGIFASTNTLKGIMTDVFSDPNKVQLPPAPAERKRYEADLAAYEETHKDLKTRQEFLESQKKTLDGQLAGNKDDERLKKDVAALDSRLNELKSRIKLLEYMKPVLPVAFGLEDCDSPADTRITIRGNAHAPGDIAPRGFVQIATLEKAPSIGKGSGRLELADWLVSPSNPLTARAYVNRVWNAVFGAGLVRTLDNMGIRGESPSHPELLDYLASNFMAEGWSVKKLVREMVLSRAFRMSSAVNKTAVDADPENRLLWRMNPQRLAGEEIRDAILRISGQLDMGRGGPSLGLEIAGNLKPFEPTFVDEKLRLPDHIRNRRTIYLPVLRKSQLESLDMLNLFGFPDVNQINSQRIVTNVPAQALYLMNSPFYQEQSRALARVTELQFGMYDRARVADLIWRVYNRPATQDEISAGADFVFDFAGMLRKQPKPPANPTEEAWTRYCQTLFASSEFLFKM